MFSFSGLRIFASRDGDRVKGHVDFPHAIYGRYSVELDYHSRRPDAPPPLPRGDIGGSSIPSRAGDQADDACRDGDGAVADTSCLRASVPSSLDRKARHRLDLVNQWRTRCEETPDISKIEHARTIAASAPIKCSWRSIQMWFQKLDALGPEGLIDGYVIPARRVLNLSGKLASDAVLVCAWWSFRIGNNESIDTKMMHAAAGLLAPSDNSTSPLAKGGQRGVQSTPPSASSAVPHSSLCVSDILATIDCYYAWPCNRARMPFKAFSKWSRYDFQKWLFRAADENDYRRVSAEMRGGNLPLPPGVRAAVSLLDPADHRQWIRLAAKFLPPDRKTRRRDALDRSTRQSIRALASPLNKGGPQGGGPFSSLHENGPLPTVAAALASLDDSYRVMLLRASAGDKDARRQALSTMTLCWDNIPDEIRSGIDRATNTPLSERRPGDDRMIRMARLRLFLPTLRRSKAGYETLAVGAGVI